MKQNLYNSWWKTWRGRIILPLLEYEIVTQDNCQEESMATSIDDKDWKIVGMNMRYLPVIACIFLTRSSGWFVLFHSGGTPKTSVVPNCSRAIAFQKDIHVVRASPAS